MKDFKRNKTPQNNMLQIKALDFRENLEWQCESTSL